MGRKGGKRCFKRCFKRCGYAFWLCIMMMTLFSGRQAQAAQAFDFQMDYNGYQLTAYEVSADVNEDGSLDITERVTAHFTEEKHGIYRAIPLAGESSPVQNGKAVRQRNLASVENISVIDAVIFPMLLR
ncbi:hypothetical protein D3C75_204590 [compost metagenome]